MEAGLIISFVVLLALLVLSGFFSGSETSFFSLNHLEKDKLRRQFRGKLRRFIVTSLRSPNEILITVLTGNMVVNLFFASILERAMTNLQVAYSSLYSIVGGTVLLLIFGEMTPKNLAVRSSLSFVIRSSRLLYYCHFVLGPVRKLLQSIETKIVRLLARRLEEPREDARLLILSTLQVGLRKGIIHPTELALLESFLDFSEKKAAEVMVPRAEVRGIEISAGREQLRQLLANEKGATPLAVYQEDLDRIVGCLNPIDLLGLEGVGLKEVLREVHLVPEGKNLLELMTEMIEANVSLAVIIDEYGGTAGAISFQRLVEEFLAFFYPQDEAGDLRVREGVFKLPGKFDMSDLEALLSTDFETESRTLSGLLIEKLGEIPEAGRRIILSGHTFLVRRVSKRRIHEVEVRRGT
jgi:CBS domain containing-hemolysin-like protein